MLAQCGQPLIEHGDELAVEERKAETAVALATAKLSFNVDPVAVAKPALESNGLAGQQESAKALSFAHWAMVESFRKKEFDPLSRKLSVKLAFL